MSVITISPSGQNITVATTGSNGIVTLTQSDSQVSTLTINQGQQGPAGVSITVDNYGDNRLTTSDGTPGGLYAEDNLTFDGSVLSVSGDLSVSGTLTVTGSGNFLGGVYSNGIPVSVSGHTHDVSDISDFNEAVDDRIGSGLFSAGTGIDLSYDDNSNSFTVSVTGLISNPTNNRILTSRDSTTTGIDAESNLTFDGSLLSVSGDLIADTGNFHIVQFNTDNGQVDTQGQIGWNDTEGTVDVALTDTAIVHIGEHTLYRIRNKTGDVLHKGQAVCATGIHPNGLISPDLYVADGSVREIRFMGLVFEDINDNNNGYVINFGHIYNIDTRGNVATDYAVGDETWLDGDILYVHPTGAGKLTKVEPKHSISVAIILDAASNGKIFVRPTSYGHLDDNHDVNVSGVTNGQFLQYDSSTDYWVPSSSGDFTELTINNNQIITGTGIVNHIPYWNTSSEILADSGELYWDNVNNRLGIGTNAPSYQLEVQGSGYFANNLDVAGSTLRLYDTGASSWKPIYANGNNLTFTGVHGIFGYSLGLRGSRGSALGFESNATNGYLAIAAGGSEKVRIATDGKVGVQTTTPSYDLDVNGSGNFSDSLFVNGIPVSVSGHTHTSSDITDFDTSVSGLLPTITNSGDNRILTSTGTSTGINAESNATFDGTTLAVSGEITIDNLKLDGNTLSATNTNGNIIVQTNGTGALQRDSGGNARGQYSVDLQNVRFANTKVAAGNYSVIGGGRDNTASSEYNTVGGGYGNTASGNMSITVAGGYFNTAGGEFSVVGGGSNNTAQGDGSTVAGGGSNNASGLNSTVGGGYNNTASSLNSTVGGGTNNIASGDYSAILGGQSNNDNGYNNVFILGSNITATQANTTFVDNLDVASTGDITTLKIDNFYHQNLSAATGLADSDLMIAIIDPTGSPTTETIQGSVLRSTLLSQPAQLQFRQGTDSERLLITPASGEPIWTTDTQKFYIGDGSTAGGDFVGPSPYDRGNGTQSIVALNNGCVASGDYSVIGGGQNNTTSGTESTVGGGSGNDAIGETSTVGGGGSNTASGNRSTVGGGGNNTASNGYTTVGGGASNTASDYYSTVGGGSVNSASGYNSTVGGGFNNTAGGSNSAVVGGNNNSASGNYSAIGGGKDHTATSTYTTVGGGFSNDVTANATTIGGGSSNAASADYATIAGGVSNTASGTNATIGGGGGNVAGSAANATVAGGSNNSATGWNSVVGGGYFNSASAYHTTIAGGYINSASSYYCTVGGGGLNSSTANGATTAGGKSNTTSGAYSSIGGGLSNNITTGTGNVIAGGRGNNNTGNYSTVSGGYHGKATRWGEVSHAAGRFASAGDAQHTVLVARRTTADATANQVLFLNGSSQRLTIPTQTMWTFEVKLSAYNDTDHEGAWWIIRGGIINNNAGDVALVGSLITENGADTSLSTASASVVADDTNDALEIRVTGVAGKDIRWVAVVDISQVSYGTP